MKVILLVVLGLLVCTQAFEVAQNIDQCQATLVKFISGSTSFQQILNKCDLDHIVSKLTLSEECLDDLSKANDLLKQLSTENNKAKSALRTHFNII